MISEHPLGRRRPQYLAAYGSEICGIHFAGPFRPVPAVCATRTGREVWNAPDLQRMRSNEETKGFIDLQVREGLRSAKPILSAIRWTAP